MSDPDPDAARRGKLAAGSGLPDAIMAHLASDPAPEVRRALARNPRAPLAVDRLLAEDGDPQVRGDLAAKLARLTPTLSAGEHRELLSAALGVLDLLARDQETAVRRIVAEALGVLPGVPAPLIRRLAHDPEPAVAVPVIAYSPVLTDADLLEIIASPPVREALAAVSRREGLSSEVADAIVHTADDAAITDLLANKSAQIREATLDLIIARAPVRRAWHGHLVRRPGLARGAALTIGRFVADALLRDLASRGDLDTGTRDALARMVDLRLRAEAGVAVDAFAAVDEPARRPRVARPGMLAEELFDEALRHGDHAYLFSALSDRTGLPSEIVRRAFERRSPRAVTALSIRAGLPPRVAFELQVKVARVPPPAALQPVEGAWALSLEEIELELALLAR